MNPKLQMMKAFFARIARYAQEETTVLLSAAHSAQQKAIIERIAHDACCCDLIELHDTLTELGAEIPDNLSEFSIAFYALRSLVACATGYVDKGFFKQFWDTPLDSEASLAVYQVGGAITSVLGAREFNRD